MEYIWLDIAQIFFALVTIYMLAVYQRFSDKIIKRDDPFANSIMLALMIFIVVVQKYIVEALLNAMLQDTTFFTQ